MAENINGSSHKLVQWLGIEIQCLRSKKMIQGQSVLSPLTYWAHSDRTVNNMTERRGKTKQNILCVSL